MKRNGQSREFWKGLAVEVEQGAKLDEVARRHQVTKSTLSWWCWRFRFDGELSKTKSHTKTRLLPVVRPDLPATISPSRVELTVSRAHVRFDVGTDLTYMRQLFVHSRAPMQILLRANSPVVQVNTEKVMCHAWSKFVSRRLASH